MAEKIEQASAGVASVLNAELGCDIARFKMGLDATLFWLEQNEKIVNENLLNDRIIRTWRKNYALNHWIFKLVKKKTIDFSIVISFPKYSILLTLTLIDRLFSNFLFCS